MLRCLEKIRNIKKISNIFFIRKVRMRVYTVIVRNIYFMQSHVKNRYDFFCNCTIFKSYRCQYHY